MAASPIAVTGARAPVGKLRWLGLWALTLAMATWAGSQLGRAGSPRVVAEPPPARGELAGTPLMPRAGDALGAAELRTIIRDELARQASDLRRPAADGDAADR